MSYELGCLKTPRDDGLGFSLKPPKWVRKAQPGKILKKYAVPIAAVGAALLIPGAAPMLAKGALAVGKGAVRGGKGIFNLLGKGEQAAKKSIFGLFKPAPKGTPGIANDGFVGPPAPSPADVFIGPPAPPPTFAPPPGQPSPTGNPVADAAQQVYAPTPSVNSGPVADGPPMPPEYAQAPGDGDSATPQRAGFGAIGLIALGVIGVVAFSKRRR